MKYIDIFAGCGGLSLGLYNAKWKGLFAIEKSPFAFETLKYNLIDKKHHFSWPNWLIKKDWDINVLLEKHTSDLKNLQNTIDLVAGGPPCQGFSMAGKRIEGDKRNSLIYSYINFVSIVKPKLLLFENVKGFTYGFVNNGNKKTVYSDLVQEKLKEEGYDVHGEVLDFSKYGVPQQRKRYILIGVRNDLGMNPKSFFNLLETEKSNFFKEKKLGDLITVQDAISDLLSANGILPSPDSKNFSAGIYGTIVSNYQILLRGDSYKQGCVPDSHRFAKHTKLVIDSFLELLEKAPKGKRIDAEEKKNYTNLNKRGITVLNPNGVSPTLTTHPDDYVHYAEPRILTVREYARLQSFPDWYEIKGKYTTGGQLRKVEVPRYTQIGNAIPPLFAELAGIVLKKMLQSI